MCTVSREIAFTLLKTYNKDPFHIQHALTVEAVMKCSLCRSGECGWCHSKRLSGEVYISSDADGRRLADKKFGWIHPCVSYPLSDVTLCVYPTE